MPYRSQELRINIGLDRFNYCHAYYLRPLQKSLKEAIFSKNTKKPVILSIAKNPVIYLIVMDSSLCSE
jgi:hypothetical protein